MGVRRNAAAGAVVNVMVDEVSRPGITLTITPAHAKRCLMLPSAVHGPSAIQFLERFLSLRNIRLISLAIFWDMHVYPLTPA